MEAYDAVIVGGGIGGLALGYKLADSGQKVCVLEARSEVRPSKRGLTLQPNGLEALDKLGLFDQVFRIGTKTSWVEWYWIGGGLLAAFDYSVLDHPQNYLLTVVPSELELVLRKAFVSRSGTIYESTSFQELLRDQSATVVVEAERAGSQVRFSAKVVVGADGENSRVRGAIRAPTKAREYPDNFLYMLVDPVDVFQKGARQYFARGKMIGCFLTHGSTYIFYYLPRGRYDEFKARGLASFNNLVTSIEPELSGALNNLNSWDDIAYAAPKRVDVGRWVVDNVALIGDAAHALDPSLAQGANMTLQDAVVLADTIEKCSELNDFSAKALRSYENARWKQVRFLQNQAERTAQVTTTESRFYSRLGKRVFKRVGKNQEMKRLVLETSCGLLDHFGILEQVRFLI